MALTLPIRRDDPNHQRWSTMLQDRIKLAERRRRSQDDKWKRAEDLLVGYVHETELDAKRRVKRENSGVPHYTTIKIPYTYALLATAHTYWTNVFLSRSPVHQYAGNDGVAEQGVLAVEALVAYMLDAGQAMAPYYLWLYDAGKYGVGIIGEYWCADVTEYSDIADVTDPTTGAIQRVQTTQRVAGYEGVHIYNVSPFDFYPDPRVPVGRFQEGEFVAVRRDISWNDILRRVRAGYYTNTELLSSFYGTTDGQRDESHMERPETDSISYPTGASSTNRPSIVSIWEVHIDLIPAEWGLGASTYPQKWVFTITRDYSLIIGASPYGYAHNKFLFEVLEPEIEAYGQWNRGIPQQVEPLQNTMDWLLNSHFYNVRATNNGLFVADPSRLMVKDFERSEPGLFVRMKPEAYGQDVRTMFSQLQTQDVTRGNVADMQVMLGIGERATGINDQLMGLTAGSSRKTATEVRTNTGFGTNRQKTTTEYMSATGWGRHAKKLLAMAQQFYDVGKKLRLVGDIVQSTGPQFLMVTPDMIAGDYSYTAVDGTLPIDRIAQANLWKEILMGMRAYPQLMMTYDITKMFSYVALLGGLRNINQMKLSPEAMAQQQLRAQLMDPALLGTEADKGNVVPITGKANNRAGGAAPQTKPAKP